MIKFNFVLSVVALMGLFYSNHVIAMKGAVEETQTKGKRMPKSIKDVEDLEKVPLESRLVERTAYDILKASAVKWPQKRALIFKPLGEPLIITYQELLDNVNQTANLLMKCGVTRGKAVSYILPNIPENYYLFFAAQTVGIANPISPNLPPEQIAELMQIAESEILITTGPQTNPQLWETILTVLKLSPRLREILVLEDYNDQQQNIKGFYSLLKREPKEPLFDATEIKPEAVCSYFHTSGTVGIPKLVQHTHRGFLHAAWAAGMFAEYERDDAVILSGSPMFHVGAAIVEAVSSALNGATLVVLSPKGWADPSVIPNFWKIVERYQATSMGAVPPIYKALLQVPLKGENIKSLKTALSGNVSLNAQDSDAFYSMTGVRVSTLWAQTEAILGCINPSPVPGDRNFGAAGLRLPYLHMTILKDNLAECRPNEPGTMYIKGPSVGTYKSPELNTCTFTPDGWFNTGDRAYKDGDSYIWVLGRASDFMFWEDNYVSLLAMETELQANPSVKKAAVISVDERVYAFLMVNPQTVIDVEQLQTTLKKQFGSLPVDFKVRDNLPLNGMGKVMKYRLKQELQAK